MATTKAITHTEQEHPVKLVIRFSIEKFEPLMESYKVGEFLWSDGVSSEQALRAVWKLRLYPNGWKEENKGDISVFLHLAGSMADGKETLDATSYIYLVDVSGNKIDVQKRKTRNFGESGLYSWGGNVDHDQVKKALHADGSLLVTADIEFHAPDDEVTPAEKRDLTSKWINSIGKLLENGAHSDCTIVVGGEQPKAHRSILSAISPVFERMFGNPAFQQAIDGIVRIEDPPGMLKDSTAKPYRALLCYAYTGRVDWVLFGDCKRDVLVLACKYLVLDLKHHVEELLFRKITAEDFTELAILADTYSCSELKKACVDYLSRNSVVVFTPQWEELAKTKVDLSFELLRLVRESKTPTPAVDEGGAK